MVLIRAYRAVFTSVRKVIGFELLHYTNGLKASPNVFIQSEVKPNTAVIHSRLFETTYNILFSVSKKSCVMLLFVWTVNIRIYIESYFTIEIVHVFISSLSVMDNKMSMMERSVEVL